MPYTMGLMVDDAPPTPYTPGVVPAEYSLNVPPYVTKPPTKYWSWESKIADATSGILFKTSTGAIIYDTVSNYYLTLHRTTDEFETSSECSVDIPIQSKGINIIEDENGYLYLFVENNTKYPVEPGSLYYTTFTLIIRSIDDGATWQTHFEFYDNSEYSISTDWWSPEKLIYLGSGHFIVNGIAWNNNCIAESLDYGLTWELIITPDTYLHNYYPTSKLLTDFDLSISFSYVKFTDFKVVGSNLLISTVYYASGAYTLSIYQAPLSNLKLITLISHVSSESWGTFTKTDPNGHFYIYGTKIFQTRNNGLKWKEITTFPSIYNVLYIDENNVLILPGPSPMIYTSSDYGRTWESRWIWGCPRIYGDYNCIKDSNNKTIISSSSGIFISSSSGIFIEL